MSTSTRSNFAASNITSSLRRHVIRLARLAKLTLTGFAFALAFSAKADPGIQPGEILIGETYSLTGTNPERPVAMKQGAEMYFKKANEQKINGRKIRVISYDDGYEPKRAIDNVRKLVNDDKVFAIFQPYGSPTVSAIVPFIQQNDVPLICPATGMETLRSPVAKNIFNVRVSNFQEAQSMVKFLVEKKGVKTFAVLYQDDALGLSGLGASQAAIEQYKVKRVAKGAYKRNSLDVSEAIKEIKAGNPEAILMWSQGGPGGVFIREAVKAGLKAYFAASSANDSDVFTSEIGATPAEIYITRSVPYVVGGKAKIYQDYVKDAKTAGVKESPAAFEGYLNASLLVEALKAAGAEPTRSGLRNAIESMHKKDFGGVALTFSETDHQGLKSAPLFHVKDGKYELISE